MFVPTPSNQNTFGTIADKMGSKGSRSTPPTNVACVTGSEHMSLGDEKRVIGLEPTTFSLEGCERRSQESQVQELAHELPTACTAACTSNAETDHADPELTTITTAWPTLPDPIKTAILVLVKSAY